MRPRTADQHLANGRRVYLEGVRNSTVTQSRLMQAFDLTNGVIVEFGESALTASRASILRDHIGHIVGLGADEQVRECDAGGIVALVQDVLSWPHAGVQEPSDRMREDKSSSNANASISIFCLTTDPDARACLGRSHLGIEAPFESDSRNRTRATLIGAMATAKVAPVGREFGRRRVEVGAALATRRIWLHRKFIPSGARPPEVAASRGPLMSGLYQ